MYSLIIIHVSTSHSRSVFAYLLVSRTLGTAAGDKTARGPDDHSVGQGPARAEIVCGQSFPIRLSNSTRTGTLTVEYDPLSDDVLEIVGVEINLSV